MELNNEQINFLIKHKVPLWSILDATWMKPKEYKEILNTTDFIVAINSNSKKCDYHKLNMRERHGRCVECRVGNYSFIKPNKDWDVYVVGSLKWQLLKVWYTQNIEDRIFHLNKDSYWWLNDWELIYSGKYKWALKIEAKVHSLLKNFWVDIKYNYYWKQITCYELFKCSYKNIQDVFSKVNNEFSDNILLIWEELPNAINIYNFSHQENKEIVNSSSLSIENFEKDDEWFKEDFEAYLRKYWIYSWKHIKNLN